MLRLRALGPAPGEARARPHLARDWRQQATWGMMLGLFTGLFTLLVLTYHPAGQTLEHDALDYWFSLRGPLSPSLQPSGQVAILAVDDATLRRWNGRVFDSPDISHLLHLLHEHGVHAAALAWQGVADGSLTAGTAGDSGAGALPAELADGGIAYLPLDLATQAGPAANAAGASGAGASGATTAGAENPAAAGTSDADLQRFAIGRVDDAQASGDEGAARLAGPPSGWLNAAAGAGDLGVQLDSDAQVRRLPLVVQRGGEIYPSLALATVLGLARTEAAAQPQLAFTNAFGSPAGLDNARALAVNGNVIPLLPGGRILLNFPYPAQSVGARPPARESGVEAAAFPDPLPQYSVDAVLDDPEVLHDLHAPCVVIGPTAASVTALLATPTGRRISATELQAVAIDNLLSGRTLARAPALATWLLTLLLCAITGGLAATRPPLWSAAVALLCFVASATLSLGLFDQQIWLDISSPWLATGLTFVTCVIARSRRQERESTRVDSTIEALAQVGEIITAQRHTDANIELILQWTQSTLRVAGAALLLLEDEGSRLRFVAGSGRRAQGLAPYTVPLGEGIAGWVARSGRLAVVNDARGDLRLAGLGVGLEDVGTETHTILCVPMRNRDALVGVLEVVNRDDGAPFTQNDAELLGAIANQAALVLENTRLYEMLSQRVVQSESDLAVTNHRLQSEKNTLQTVLQSMTDGVVVCDRDERVRLVNPAAARLLEVQALTSGLMLRDLLPELTAAARDDADAAADSTSAATAAAAGAGRLQLQRGGLDAPRLLEARQAPLQGAEGNRIGTLWVLADVTERRGIEQAKSDFVSFVAHEMRSPLTSISGFSAMLQSQEPQPVGAMPGAAPPESSSAEVAAAAPAAGPVARARYLGIIHSESERLTRLINNLLDVARIEAGRGIELNRELFDTAAMVLEVVASQRGYSTRHRIALQIEPGLPPLWADRDKVAQVLINLVSNAMKYSPGGTVTVGVRRTRSPQGDAIEIGVRDEGTGIAPEQRPHLFERFGRIAAEAQPVRVAGVGGNAKPTGTGLGLFLARHLTEAHGGHIWIDPEGPGARFVFTVPVVAAGATSGG